MLEYTSNCAERDIKRTFDMLVDRISTLENLAQIQHDASILAECWKYGRLNNKILGVPFAIARYPANHSNDHVPQYSTGPNSSVLDMAISLIFDHSKCNCTEPIRTLELMTGKEYADKIFSSDESTHPSDAGWSDSRFFLVECEALQRYIDSIFKESMFSVSYFDYELVSISNKSGSEFDIPTLLEQVPKILQILGHGVSCISGIDITELQFSEMIKTIQKAAHLQDGALKDECVRKCDSYTHLQLQRLSEATFINRFQDVYHFLVSKGIM